MFGLPRLAARHIHSSNAFRLRSNRFIISICTIPLLKYHQRKSLCMLTQEEDASNLDSDVYLWHDGAEDQESYRFGGYHPTHIGDKYHDNRYEIIHKLGAGSYSTVWLAKDHREDDLVAIKIMVSEYSKESIDTEIKALKLLATGSEDHLGRRYVPSILNQFIITGPNGHHHCIVTKAAGSCIAHTKDECPPYKFSVNIARTISAQALLGLAYIHSCGVIHGDIHSKNILFPYLFPTKSQDIAMIYNDIGEPGKLSMERNDGQQLGPEAPEYCVLPAFVGKPCSEIVEADAQIIISDFGQAFFQNDHSNKELRTPLPMLPPEFIFGEQPMSPAVDIWSLGGTLFDLLGCRRLFEAFIADEDDVLAEMISHRGPLPKRWWDIWQNKTIFFDENGSWKENDRHHCTPWSLEKKMNYMGRDEDFSPQEKRAVGDLLKKMLTYEPSERISAQGAIDSEWMQKWGIPAIRRRDQIAAQVDR